MKTILSDATQKSEILHAIATKNHGIVTDIQVLSLPVIMQEEKDNKAHTLLTLKKILTKQADSYPIYQEMFMYPSFLEEILSFGKECLLWDIQVDDLPTETESEKELQKILKVVFSLDLAEKKMLEKKDTILASNQDIELYPSFYMDQYHYNLFQQLKEKYSLISFPSTAPEKELYYGLNVRQEIEAVAQDISKTKKSANIVLCDYGNQYPVVKQVFQRYGIPFSCIKSQKELHIPSIFMALCTFAQKKDKESFFNALTLNAFSSPCPLSLMDEIKERMDAQLQLQTMGDKLVTSPYSKDALTYQKIDEQCQSYFAQIQEEFALLLSANTPQEIFTNAYQVLCQSSYLRDEDELNAGMKIRSDLQEMLNEVNEEDVSFFIEMFHSTQCSSSTYDTDFCMVTDLVHPVKARSITYVLGCSANSYPGFPTLKGLFDEAYVQRISKFPSLSLRHTSYREQLQWIEHSATEQLKYSYATNDYAGHEIQLALEIESLFPSHAEKKWPLDVLHHTKQVEHQLSTETATALFTREDHQIHGSVSSIERWFQCPYSYFLQVGLLPRTANSIDIDAFSIGTIQHAVLEKTVTEKGKNYTDITQEDILNYVSPFIDSLKVLHPNEVDRIEVTKARIIQSIQTTFLFLSDMEANTSFIPKDTEHEFTENIIDGVSLHGFIDRYDTWENYFRVIDYKSSIHKLSEKNVKAGISLQLLTYMIMAKKITQKDPAGAYYFSLKNESFEYPTAKLSRDIVSENVLDDTSIKAKLINARRLSGWTFDENTVAIDENNAHIISVKTKMEYDLCAQCMNELYQYFHDHLLQGEISLAPLENACTFCDYYSICHFQSNYRKRKPLVLTDVSLKAEKEDK